MLLPELVVSIILLLSKNAGLVQEAGAVPLLGGLLEHLDRFNHLAPGRERDDQEELAWPGIMGTASPRGLFGRVLSGLPSSSSPLGGVLVREGRACVLPGAVSGSGGCVLGKVFRSHGGFSWEGWFGKFWKPSLGVSRRYRGSGEIGWLWRRRGHGTAD